MSAAAKARTKAVKEDTVDYDAGGQYLPVHDKDAALQDIFSKGEADYGLAMFPAHDKESARLVAKGRTLLPPLHYWSISSGA